MTIFTHTNPRRPTNCYIFKMTSAAHDYSKGNHMIVIAF